MEELLRYFEKKEMKEARKINPRSEILNYLSSSQIAITDKSNDSEFRAYHNERDSIGRLLSVISSD